MVNLESVLTVSYVNQSIIECYVVGRVPNYSSLFVGNTSNSGLGVNCWFAIHHLVLVENYETVTTASQIDILVVECHTVGIALRLGCGCSKRSLPCPLLCTGILVVTGKTVCASAYIDVVSVDGYGVLTIVWCNFLNGD